MAPNVHQQNPHKGVYTLKEQVYLLMPTDHVTLLNANRPHRTAHPV